MNNLPNIQSLSFQYIKTDGFSLRMATSKINTILKHFSVSPLTTDQVQTLSDANEIVQNISFPSENLNEDSTILPDDNILKGEILEVTPKNFETITSKGLVILEFWAPWARISKEMLPISEELSGKLQESVVFSRINTDKYIQIANSFNVRSVPTFLFFNDGKEVKRVTLSNVSEYTKRDLLEIINKVF